MRNLLESIKQGLRQGSFISEAAVSHSIVVPVLLKLGWPVFDPSIVIPEYTIEGRRVDFALCHPTRKPTVFIEVKKVGCSEGADRQVSEYAFLLGVPLAILTDGQEWSFFLPGEEGRFDERRVYKVDLLERSIEEASNRLFKYLKYEDICSGNALEAARSDYKDIRRDRQIDETLPRAWATLIDEQDSSLLELLADKVEDLCGYKPEIDICSQFLQKINKYEIKVISEPPKIPIRSKISRTYNIENFSFKFRGAAYEARSARDVMTKIFQLIAQENNGFLEKFAARKHGRKRRYLSRDRRELYPGRADLVQDHSIEVVSGWWLGTNYSRKNMQDIINLAIEVAGLRRGIDIDVNVSG